MAYTSNTPQKNQTIASTTDPIRNNFTFINTDLQVDHSFNGNSTGAEGTHLQCRMKGQASPPTLLANNAGAYYVDTQSNAQFYDGTDSYKMNLWRDIIQGNVTFTSNDTDTSIGINPTALPNQVFGVLYFYGPQSSITINNAVGCQQVFFTSSSKVKVTGVVSNVVNPIRITYDCSIADVKVQLLSSVIPISGATTYWWTLVYRGR